MTVETIAQARDDAFARWVEAAGRDEAELPALYGELCSSDRAFRRGHRSSLQMDRAPWGKAMQLLIPEDMWEPMGRWILFADLEGSPPILEQLVKNNFSGVIEALPGDHALQQLPGYVKFLKRNAPWGASSSGDGAAEDWEGAFPKA